MLFNVTYQELQLVSGYLFSQSVWIGCVFIMMILIKNIFKIEDSPFVNFVTTLPCILMLANFICALQTVSTSGIKFLFNM